MSTKQSAPLWEDNGILGRVPGQYIAAAGKNLPDPTTSTAEEVSAVVDAAWLGQVRVTFRRSRVRHHKHSHWFWAAFRADAVSAPAPPASPHEPNPGLD